MISVQTALAHLETHRPSPTTEPVDIASAEDRILAQAVTAKISMPPFSASNMDGYAITACEKNDILEIIGESAAGTPFSGAVGQGQAVRISTGAMIPNGADRVLIQEKSDRDGRHLTVKDAPEGGTHIRPAGSDFHAGDPLFELGHRLTAADLTLLAAAGHATILVQSKLRIAIFSTGNELRPVGEALTPGQIHAANAVGLVPLLERWGADVTSIGILPDDPDIIEARLEHLSDFDIIVPIGGASVGDHDHLRPSFRRAGFQMIFETVALRPGKPSWMATREKQIALGLPGNPASSFVCAHLFLRPLLGQMTPILSAKLEGKIEENGPRETYLRGTATVKQGQIRITPFPLQDSFRLRPQSSANALIRIPPLGGPHEVDDLMDIVLIEALA